MNAENADELRLVGGYRCTVGASLCPGGPRTDTEESAPTGVAVPTSQAGVASVGASRRPREDEIDAHGVTHPGKVRRDNQDHYLLCSLRRQVVVRSSSI